MKHLPIEVWVKIFSYLPPEALHTCQLVCSDWRHEILFMIESGKIPRLGLKCTRLKFDSQIVNEHRRSTWDTISLCADRPVMLVGVGIYLPSGHTMICVDARPIQDPLRPIDVSTELDCVYEDDGRIITLFGKPQSKKPFRFRMAPGEWWEIVLNIRPVKSGYDPMGGNTVWSPGGSQGLYQVQCWGVTFKFRETLRESPWRSDITQGQFPFFYFWRL